MAAMAIPSHGQQKLPEKKIVKEEGKKAGPPVPPRPSLGTGLARPVDPPRPPVKTIAPTSVPTREKVAAALRLMTNEGKYSAPAIEDFLMKGADPKIFRNVLANLIQNGTDFKRVAAYYTNPSYLGDLLSFISSGAQKEAFTGDSAKPMRNWIENTTRQLIKNVKQTPTLDNLSKLKSFSMKLEAALLKLQLDSAFRNQPIRTLDKTIAMLTAQSVEVSMALRQAGA